MELKYVWIKDYKNIKNVGFNFNHSKKVKFEFKNNELRIEEYDSNIPTDFFGTNFQGITCIVGENGSGKTNLSEYINYSLSHVSNGGLWTYLKLEGFIILDNKIIAQDNIVIKNTSQLKREGYEILRYDMAPLDKGQGELRWHKMEVNKYIYYNPICDFRVIPVHSNLINISTSNLIYDDFKNSNRTFVTYVNEKNKISAHRDNEKMREVDFILNFNKSENFIDNTPSKLWISIDRVVENKLLKKRFLTEKEIGENNELERINKLQDELNGLESYLLDINDFKEFKSSPKENSPHIFYKIPIEFKKDIFYKLFIIKHFQILLNANNLFPNGFFRKFIYDEKYESLSDNILESKILDLKISIIKLVNLAEWQEIDESYSHDYKDQEDDIYKIFGSLIINLTRDENKKLVGDLINLSKEITKENSPIYYEFTEEFSSGQKQLLNFYSRFYWAKDKIVKSENDQFGIKGEVISIFIDEGEVALHPEWQRLFFNKIRMFFELLFKDYKIQLILTTHSPFVLSDLPKENVLFLTKNEYGLAELNELDEKNTFGANIHDLISNSFFMQSSIGEFAKTKIKGIVDFYYKVNKAEIKDIGFLKEEYSTLQKQFKYTHQIVGDEIIQNVIKNHIDFIEKKLLDQNDIDQQILDLENELKILKKRKGSDKN